VAEAVVSIQAALVLSDGPVSRTLHGRVDRAIQSPIERIAWQALEVAFLLKDKVCVLLVVWACHLLGVIWQRSLATLHRGTALKQAVIFAIGLTIQCERSCILRDQFDPKAGILVV
jgi:hypothetical protein